ncbi:hypothetical protein niasHS_001458 [Heterodera schachtii]|uniref:Uncharacterized protein n=1 Tax=Heterodera schachtii TaxID=97005 RepID=A0ABD2KDH6_HETSC
MVSTKVHLCSSLLIRFPTKNAVVINCRTLSTGQQFLSNNAPLSYGAELLEYNRRLVDRTQIEITHKSKNGAALLHFFRVALCYSVHGITYLASHQKKLQWIPRDANDRRNWKLCVTLKAIIPSLSPLSAPSPPQMSSASSFSSTNSASENATIRFALPINQAKQLLHCLEQLQIAGGSDGDCAGNAGPLNLQHQRLSGPLFGFKKSAFYLSVCRPSKALSGKPLVFLSEHQLLPNEFHAWHSVVNSLPLSLCCLPELRKCLRLVLEQPEATSSDQHRDKQSSNASRKLGQMFLA